MTFTKGCSRNDLHGFWSSQITTARFMCGKCGRQYDKDYKLVVYPQPKSRDEYLANKRANDAMWLQYMDRATLDALTAPYRPPCGSFQ